MRVFTLVALASCVACGSTTNADDTVLPDSGTPNDSSTSPDVAVEASIESGTDAGGYPAFDPDMPQILTHGGNVLSKPRFITVTWSADPNEASFQTFGDALGASNYWNATTSEYGVAAGVSGSANHVSITDAPPATMTDTALTTFVAAQVGAAWPDTDNNTVYMVYLPTTLKLTSNGQNACGIESGYHDETYTASNAPIAYGVVLESCHGQQDVVQYSTDTASHEFVETATDPFFDDTGAWYGFDANHFAWEEWTQRNDEVADACEFNDDANYTDVAPLAYMLQRSWSNASAKAGHNPCAPVPSAPNFSGVALNTQAISIAQGQKTIATKGYTILVGQSQTIHVGLYSDAPTSDWTVSVVEGDGFSSPSPHLTITQSATTGNNGTTIDVGITATATRPQGVLATIVSTQNSINHYYPFLVATQ